MLDTISFKIHDLQEHGEVAEFMDKSLAGKGTTQSLAEPLKDSDYVEYRNREQWRRFVEFHDTGKRIEMKYFRQIKSSHYDIIYTIDRYQDCIWFNLSIPKYYYGTNIVQWIPKFSDPSYKVYPESPLYHHMCATYKPLMNFFKSFFTRWFPDYYINPTKVEINRIDFCFNQVYLTRGEAFQTLAMMKRIKRNQMKDTTSEDQFTDRHGGFSWKTKDYSIKVYHKGLEYRTSDKKSHLHLNKKFGKEYFPIEHLQNFADRILRFEMTLRSRKISDIYKQRVFRIDDEIHQKYWKIFKSINSSGHLINARGEKQYYVQLKTITKKFVKYMSNIYNKNFAFHLATSSDFDYSIDPDIDKILNERRKDKLPFERNMVFSKSLFVELGKYFIEFVKEFQPNSCADLVKAFAEVEAMKITKKEKDKQYERVISHLRTRYVTKRSINYGKLALLIRLMSIYSFEEIRKLDLFPRSTWYRYQQELKRLGVTKASFGETDLVPEDRMNFTAYNDWIFSNIHRLEIRNPLF